MGQYQTKQLLYNEEKMNKLRSQPIKQAKILTNPTSDKRLIPKNIKKKKNFCNSIEN